MVDREMIGREKSSRCSNVLTLKVPLSPQWSIWVSGFVYLINKSNVPALTIVRFIGWFNLIEVEVEVGR